ncbi:MAG: glycosyltransferase [Actinomycetes bacterium]
MLSLALGLFALALTTVNALTMRVVKPMDATVIEDSVDILIPMRNESANLQAVIKTAKSQTHISRLSLAVLDDNSTDDTRTLLNMESELSEFTTLTGQQLPPGWLGKPYACNQLASATTGDYIVFLDADVRLDKSAVAAAIANMKRWNWEFLSPYPRESAGSFLENLIQPLLQWSWLASVPLRLVERFPQRSTTIANGQFFIVTRTAYETIGGHGAIPTAILDDLELARALVSAGFKGGVAEGSAVAACRMYTDNKSLISGYTKSLWSAFGGVPGTILALTLLFWTGIVPITLAIMGSPIGWIAYFAIWFSRIVAALRTKGSTSIAFLHPISILVLFYLISLSWIRKSRGELTWRDRKVG